MLSAKLTTNAVYKLCCINRFKIYLDETKRSLKSKIASEKRLYNKYEFDWNYFCILVIEIYIC